MMDSIKHYPGVIQKVKFKLMKANYFGEYVVRVSIDGERVMERDYFTDDRADARRTMVAMVQEETDNYEVHKTSTIKDGFVVHRF